MNTVENPLPGQLEAGGKISGAYFGALHFADEELRGGSFVDGTLTIGADGFCIRYADGSLPTNLTITSYTPPLEPVNPEDALETLRRIAQEMNDDPEAAHGEADKVLLSVVDPAVRDAYRAVIDACDWWACA